MLKFIVALIFALGMTGLAHIVFPSMNSIGFSALSVYVNGTMLVCAIFFMLGLRVVHGK